MIRISTVRDLTVTAAAVAITAMALDDLVLHRSRRTTPATSDPADVTATPTGGLPVLWAVQTVHGPIAAVSVDEARHGAAILNTPYWTERNGGPATVVPWPGTAAEHAAMLDDINTGDIEGLPVDDDDDMSALFDDEVA